MSVDRVKSVHLSDEDLITLLYMGDLAGSHAADCATCRERLNTLQSNRVMIEREQLSTTDVTPERLAAQRRGIYGRISQSVPVWSFLLRPRWISAAATAIILGGGLFVFQHQQAVTPQEDTISDSDLAQEVSRLSQSPEPLPAAPLKGLFE